MKTYKILLARYPTPDIGNGIRLHLLFDSRAFIIIPKASTWRVHFLNITTDYGRLFHNRKTLTITLPREFMFARFAWAVIPFAKGFATRLGFKVKATRTVGLCRRVIYLLPSHALLNSAGGRLQMVAWRSGVSWIRLVGLDAGTAAEVKRELKPSARYSPTF